MYSSVAKIPNFPEMEHRHLDFWREQEIFKKLRQRNAGKPPWSFLDGPITANNPMGVHHAWGRSYKDMFQRYHAMMGRDLRYQNGFDCQGLWVEVEVEKEHGFKTKGDIREYGLDRFTKSCKERVLTFAARQTEQSIRLGYWTDWDDPKTLLQLRDALHKGDDSVTIDTPSGEQVTGSPEELIGRLGSADFGGSYFTFSTENNYTIWAFLKKCFDEGYVYRGSDVMPWCCRCGTGLSQMEVAEGRKITSHTSVFVRFPLLDREDEALLVWTTTPWTLTSNVAAAVNPEMTYLKLRHGDSVLYVGKGNFAKARVQDLEAAGQRESHTLHTVENILKGSGKLEILGEVSGKELVGLRYQGPFDHLDAQNTAGGVSPFGPVEGVAETSVESHRVIAWEDVSDAEGTGIVHIAPGCGSEDHGLGVTEKLPVIAPLADGGEYVDGFGEWSGRHVHGVVEDLIQDLKQRGVLVAREKYPHVYPHCWRCKEELVFRLVDEWFIRMDWRDRIQKIVPDIRWIPGDGEAREQDWLLNMGDWMISKKRFWGLALPIWVCDSCEHFTVVGGEEELKEKAIAGWEEFEGHTPHRPFVDKVKLACEKCGGESTRIEDVGNPWLDAGIVPFSTVHYNSDRHYWEQWFPADFVVECFPGQFRNWFYALLAMSAMMEERAPFKVLLGHALVRDERGEEMHKSSGNAIAFDEAADILGAEIMRYLYAAQNPTQNLNFPDINAGGGTGGLADETRRKLLTLWNCYSFFVTYAQVDQWKPSDDESLLQSNELDRWITSRLQRLVGAAHEAFADYALFRFVGRFEAFQEEFSNWYLRRSRRRFYKSETDGDKEAAYATLYNVLTTVTRLLAPLLPFLSEELYQNLVVSIDRDAPASVHLTDYPQVVESLLDDTLEAQIATVIRIKNAVLKLRNQTKMKTRQPLSRIIVRPRDAAERAVLADPHFADQLKDECNVEHVELIESEEGLVSSSIKPNFKTLGPRYGKIMKQIGAAIASADAPALLDGFDDEGNLQLEVAGEMVELTREDLDVRHQGPDGLAFLFDYGSFIALDTVLTEALKSKGIARDFNRQAQDQRKQVGCEVSDRIRVCYTSSDCVAAAITEHQEYLRGELLALEITRVDALPELEDLKVGDEKVRIAIERA